MTVGVTVGVVPPLEVVVLLVVVEDDGPAAVELVEVVVLVCCWLPGMHWEYQSLLLTQVAGASHLVGPVKP